METTLLQKTFLPWIFPVFIFIFTIIALLRVAYPNHFWEYLKLPFDRKYIIIYEKKERKVQPFTAVSFFLQWLSLNLFLYVWTQFHNIPSKLTGFLLLDIALTLFALLTFKLLIQKWISFLFDLKGFSKPYVFARIAYSSYAAIFTVILLFFMIYSGSLNEKYLYILLAIFLIINILSWITIIKMNQKSIKSYIIYFILYLCTLEIAPYVFLAYGSRFL